METTVREAGAVRPAGSAAQSAYEALIERLYETLAQRIREEKGMDAAVAAARE